MFIKIEIYVYTRRHCGFRRLSDFKPGRREPASSNDRKARQIAKPTQRDTQRSHGEHAQMDKFSGNRAPIFEFRAKI